MISERAHELATGVYGLEGIRREWIPRKGYTFVSEKYPGGVPRTMGRFIVAGPPSAWSTQQALSSPIPHSRAAAMLISSGVPAITAGEIIRYPQNVENILSGVGGVSMSDRNRGILGGGRLDYAGRGITVSGAGRGVGATAAAPAGVGVAAPGQVAAGLGSGIGGDLSAMGSGVMNTAASYIPLATKLILLAIGVKAVLWLIGGKK